MSTPVDENRTSVLVAFTLKGGGAAVGATRRAILASAGLNRGRVVRPGGGDTDPCVVDFRAATGAFAFALETLGMAARFNDRHADAPLDLRLGVHADTVWFVGEEAIGDAPAVAAHLAGEAQPGAACASADALSRLASASAWALAERPAVRVPGVEREIPVLDARPRPAPVADDRSPVLGTFTARPDAPPASTPRSGAAVEDRSHPAWANVPLPPRPPGAPATGRDIVAGLAEIGRAVVDEIVDRSREIDSHEARAAVRRAARQWRDQVRDERHHHQHEEDGDEGAIDEEQTEGEAEVPVDLLQRRKKDAARRAGKAVAGFVSHATSFLLVGGGIVAINVLLAPAFPWSFFPVAGWGIGLVCHVRSVVAARRRARQLRNLEALSGEQLGLVERIQKAASGFGGHTAAYLAVNGYFAGINLITSPGHLWFLYPALAWGIGYVMHWTRYLSRKSALVRELGDTGLSWGDVRAGRRVSGGHAVAAGPSLVRPGMEHYELVREARAIRDGLVDQLGKHEEVGKRMGEDVTELLGTYVEQLEMLVLRNDEFRSTLASLPRDRLEREIADYRAKAAGTEHAGLRQEYEKAVEQGERQLRSLRELGHQKEILGVRVQSAFGLLKQLELDFVRLKNAASSDEVQVLATIRSKSHEISDYLVGLDEVERGG